MINEGAHASSLGLALPGEDVRLLTANKLKPARQYDQTLSIVLDDKSGVIAGVRHKADVATFWKLASGEFIGQIPLQHPVGVSLVAEGFLISSHEGLTTVDPLSLKTTTHQPQMDGRSFFAHHLTCPIQRLKAKT